jgi:purine nucleosidase
MRHSIQWSLVERWGRRDTAKARFVAATMEKTMLAEKDRKATGWLACDPLAVALAVTDGLLTSSQRVFCSVELHGKLTRGQTVFDLDVCLKREPNIELVKTIDMGKFSAMLDAALG